MSQELVLLLAYWRKLPAVDLSQPLVFPPSLTLVTDASKEGWGFHTSLGQEGRGRWSSVTALLHINLLEMLAVLVALKSLCPSPQPGGTVLVRSDNTMVVNCLNRGGSARSPPLNRLTLRIWSWMRKLRCHLQVSHLRGVLNTRADALSRSKLVQTEWCLDRDSFRWLSRLTSTHPPKSTCALRRQTQDCRRLSHRLRCMGRWVWIVSKSIGASGNQSTCFPQSP